MHLKKSLCIVFFYTFCSNLFILCADSQLLNKENLIATHTQRLAQMLSLAGAKPSSLQAKTFNNCEVNAQSLQEFASKTPVCVREQVAKWLAENKDLMKSALGNQLMIGTVRPCHEKTWQFMKDKDLQNLSAFNYVFHVPQTDLIMFIAGHVNRKENLKRLAAVLAGTKYEWGKQLTREDWTLFQKSLSDDDSDLMTGKKKTIIQSGDDSAKTMLDIDRMPRTYQTVSRFASYLLFLEAQKKFQFKHIATPQTHLVHIPGRPDHISDVNYVVVQNIEDIEDVGVITAEEEKEIAIAIRWIGLFNCNAGTLKRRKSDGKVVMLDFEQPNNSNPLDFFYKNHQTFLGNGGCGLEEYVKNYVVK